MSLIDLRRRLERIEAERNTGAPTRILADRPMNDAEAAHALANWRAWTVDGRAELVGTTLCIQAPAMTEQEWIARHVTAH